VIELALFDVDGTLLLTPDPLVGEALSEVLGVANEIDRLDHAGRTTAWIARGLLDGREPPAGWCRRTEELYAARLGDTSGWRTRLGAAEALAAIGAAGIELALLTGNPEGIARLRMERLGLARFFPPGGGAFGCESERREQLIVNALHRAGLEPGQAVEIGDTPVDVESAHAAGIRSIAFVSCHPDRVAQADAVVESMAELTAVLLEWRVR
jgi:phosphoglycolate phosphatase